MTRDMFGESSFTLYGQNYKEEIAKTIVSSIFSEEVSLEKEAIEEKIPAVTVLETREEFTVQTISAFHPISLKFIHEFIHLEIEAFPELEVESFCALPFRFFELDAHKYLVTETVIGFSDREKLEKAKEVITNIKSQLRLGLRSNFYARMVMEMKGNSLDGKTAYVQERVVNFIRRFPKLFDYDVISVMNQFLKDVAENFIKDRSVKDISEIILSLYLFSKKLGDRGLYKSSVGREVLVKTRSLFVEELFGRKKVVGMVVALSHLYENERLGKEHLLKACRKFARGAHFVEDSFITCSLGNGDFPLYYFELEKKEEAFTNYEKRELQAGILQNLDSYIQKYARKIFMPQNTEEVIKYTVALSKELKNPNDFPQVAVLFESQTTDSLLFTVILVRAKVKGTPAAFEVFTKKDEKGYSYKIKHVRLLGEFKEGIEIAYSMRVSSFMREDYSVDIYRARSKIIQDLQKRFGVIRDYNGGMLEKQGDKLVELQNSLRKRGIKNSVLVENFFYALSPSEIRAILDAEMIAEFFLAFYDMFSYKVQKDTMLNYKEDSVIFIANVKSERKKEAFLSEIKFFEKEIGHLVFFSLRLQEKYYLGASYKFSCEEEKVEFINKMSLCLKL